MDNEMNVKLGLDTSSYEKSIDGALKVFNSFQTKLNDTKLGFSPSQVSELHKIFTDIRSTATSELAKIQKRIDSLNAKDVKLNLAYDTNIDKMNALKAEIEVTWSATQRAKLENRLDTLQQKLNALDGELTLNDEDLKEAKNDYNFLLKELQVNPLEFDFESPSLIKFNTMIDNVLNGLKRTGEEFDKLDKKVNKVARTSTRLNLMGRIMSQIKNTIAAAINPLNIFRKGWNEIIMSDTSSFGATFKQIGENILNFVTPAFEKVAMWILKLLSYVNIFLKAVTGGKLDLFAKTASSAKSAVNSAKTLQKMTANFDEINDIGSDSGGSSGSSEASPISMPKVDTKWANAIKSAGKWINKNWKAIAIGIGAIAAAILLINLACKKSASSLATISGGFSNLLSSLGKAIEIIAILGGISAVLLTLTEVIKAITAATEAGANICGTMITIMGSIIALVAALTIAAKLLQSPLAMAGLAVLAASISAILLVVAATLPTILDACGKFTQTVAPAIIAVITTINEGIENIIYAIGTVLPPIITAIGRNFQIVFSGIEAVVKSVGGVMDTIFNGIAKIILSVGTSICNVLNTAKSLVTTVLSAILNFINKLGPAVNNFIDNTIKGVTKLINFMISGIEYLVNTLVINGVNKIIKAINSVSKYVGITIPTVPEMSIPRFVPKLDVGTGYVPNDMLAVIHQGEAVIPKEFNNKEYFGGTNEETNNLLELLIERVDNINFSPYTTIKDVGKAAVNYINDKNRTMGRSMI